MQVKSLYQGAIFETLGFRPASNAIKPVHVANGLTRAIAGFYGDAAPLHEAVRLKASAGRPPRPPKTAAELRSLPAFADCDDATIASIRAALNELVTADHAVNPGPPNFSSYTLSHQLMCTSDPRDAGIGKFLWQLLASPPGSDAPALGLLDRILTSDLEADGRDDLTTAVMPLLSPHTVEQVRDLAEVPVALRNLSGAKAPSMLLASIRSGMDRLAEREEAGPRLLLLRRMVLLGSIGVHLHLVQWQTELDTSLQAPRDYCPILLDLTREPHGALAEASRDSCLTAMNYVDELARYLIREHLRREWAGRNLEDGRVVRSVLAELADVELDEVYDDMKTEIENPLDRLAGAVFVVGSQAQSSPPSDFARYLAQRAGLIGPRHGRGRKGYQISLELLEILTLATVPAGEVWPVPTLLEAWWERFGIIVGGRDGDLDVLTELSIDRVSQDDLDANTDRLVTLLQEQGLARRYGDGVRQIGDF